jgi:hypothetical protein
MGSGASAISAYQNIPDSALSILSKDYSNGCERGTLWGLSSNNDVFHCAMSSYIWTWSKLRCRALQIASSFKGGVWIISEEHEVFFRAGIGSAEWIKIKAPAGDAPVHIACGGHAVWATAGDGSVYLRDGCCDAQPMGLGWRLVDGRLKMLSVSPSGRVVGVNRAGKIFYRSGVTDENPMGDAWAKIAGAATSVAAGDCALWALSKSGEIFFRAGFDPSRARDLSYWGERWQKCDGRAAHLSTGSGVVYIVSDAGVVSRREGLTIDDLKGTGWTSIDMKMLSVSAGGVFDHALSPSIYSGGAPGPGATRLQLTDCPRAANVSADAAAGCEGKSSSEGSKFGRSSADGEGKAPTGGGMTLALGGRGVRGGGFGGLAALEALGGLGFGGFEGAFGMGAVMYTWQMVRRTVRLQRRRTGGRTGPRGATSSQTSPSYSAREALNRFRSAGRTASGSSGPPAQGEGERAIERERRAQAQGAGSPSAAVHDEEDRRAEDEDCCNDVGGFVAAVGMGPLTAQSGGGNDEAAQWKVDFAPSDCAHVTLQNVASGKFMNFDARVKLPHCNSKAAKSCPVKILSDPTRGCVSIEFVGFPGVLLAFRDSGAAAAADLQADARGELEEGVCTTFRVELVE